MISRLLYKTTDQGVVALITTIIVSLLLVVITTSAIALMSKELRQASDFDNSAKAYFAAESGVEDAIAVLRRELADADTSDTIPEIIDVEKPGAIGACDPFDRPGEGINPSLSNDASIAYTCQILTTLDNKVEGELVAGAANQIDLNGVDPALNRLRISWNKLNTTDPQGFSNASFSPYDPDDFPAGDFDPPWEGRLPAVMEITVVSYPTAGPFSEAQIDEDTLVLRPAGGGTSENKSFNTPPNQQPILINCEHSGDYGCSIELTSLPSNRTFVISLHARYSQAHYKVEALSGGGTALDIPDAQLVIDVTGKAGSVFRRVQAKVPLNPQTEFPFFTILADEAICKVLDVLRVSDTADNETACGSP